MRSRLAGLGWAVAALTGCAPAPNPAAMLAAADSLDARFVAAFNNRDAAAVAALYADSGSVSIGPDGAIATGRAEIEAGLKPTMAAMAGLRLDLSERHSRVVGTTVVTWGVSRLMSTAGSDARVLMEGRFSDVKAQRDGRWVYVLDHASVPTPAPAPDSTPAR